MYVRPDRVEGMATLSALLTVPEAAALIEALGQYADAIEDDPDDRELVHAPSTHDVTVVEAARRRRTRRGDRSLSDR